MPRKRVEGTHQGDKSNVPNTCAPRTRRKGDTKAEAKLARRIAEFKKMKAKTAVHQPGSLNRKKG